MSAVAGEAVEDAEVFEEAKEFDDLEVSAGKRHWWQRRRRPEPVPEQVCGQILIPELAGPPLQESFRRAAKGHYGPRMQPIPATTRQAEILNPAIVGAPTDDEGVLIGVDLLSKLPVAHVLFEAYSKGDITSPNVAAVGVIGSGKSALLKTCYVMRPLVLRNRRVMVMDTKDKEGEGEYSELTRYLGGEPFKMIIGSDEGGTRLNILDPVILQGGGLAVQRRLLRTVAETAMGAKLTPRQAKALALAHRRVLRLAEGQGRVPVLEDLVSQVGLVLPQETPDESAHARELLHEAGMEVRYVMEEAILEDLEGLFDGETSKHVQLQKRLTSVDISQLPEDGPAVALVMAVSNVWLMGMLRHQRGMRTSFIAEEGWHLVSGPSGELFRSNSKLSRGLGLSTVAAFHHPGDIPAGSPGEAMLKEAQTIHMFRQDRDEDIEATARMFGLAEGSRELLGSLPQGEHLLKIGTRRELHVRHVRSRTEVDLTNTDSAMLSTGEVPEQELKIA